MTPTSTKSKRSTESATATKKSRWFRLGRTKPQLLELDGLMDLYWGGPERRLSKLTVRIIGINFTALVMLLIGIIYLGQYQNTLIENSLRTFKSEIELISASLSEVMDAPQENPAAVETTRRMVWKISRISDQRVYLFNENGRLIADSKNLQGYEDIPRFSYPENNADFDAIEVLKKMAKFVLHFLPTKRSLPFYHDTASDRAADYPDSADAMRGTISMSAWQKNDDVILVAAAPVFRQGHIIGTVMLVREGRSIARDLGDVWMNIVMAFAITLVLTTLLSIYLSNVITTPLRQLAKAAEAVRRGKSKDTEIPDLSDRKDEIGELSTVLREMTQALWDRMDSIERFAADVAHELKNPLTSLRSAVETVSVVKKDKDREKLLDIIKDDVERMDRLITDISSASRLDAELSREALEPVDLHETLERLIEIHESPLVRGLRSRNPQGRNIRIIPETPEKSLVVWGLESRIFQVFDNLLTNAISFSPDDGHVIIRAEKTRKNITVTIDDQGPGIPENKLETIFERFYTERPHYEAYGKHSGLGLSICRQIVTALGGQIFAENIKNENGEIAGARFTVILNAV